MRILRELFQFYISASIHVAIAVVALLLITQHYLDIPQDKVLMGFVFFGTITGYNFVKYAKIAKLYHRRLTKHLKIIQIFSFLSFCALCYYALLLPLQMWYFLIPLALLTFLYAIPFFDRFSKNLRTIPGLKIAIVSFVWAGVTVVLPSLGNSIEMSTLILLFVQRMFIVAVLILPFDIRDISFDDDALKTLPQRYGIQQTKKIGFALLLFALTLEFLITEDLILKNTFLGVSLLSFFFLMRAQEKQSPYYSSFWVESIPIMWGLLLLGIHNF